MLKNAKNFLAFIPLFKTNRQTKGDKTPYHPQFRKFMSGQSQTCEDLEPHLGGSGAERGGSLRLLLRPLLNALKTELFLNDFLANVLGQRGQEGRIDAFGNPRPRGLFPGHRPTRF